MIRTIVFSTALGVMALSAAPAVVAPKTKDCAAQLRASGPPTPARDRAYRQAYLGCMGLKMPAMAGKLRRPGQAADVDLSPDVDIPAPRRHDAVSDAAARRQAPPIAPAAAARAAPIG